MRNFLKLTKAAFWRLAAGGLVVVLLNACGGGGGSATPTSIGETINGITVPPEPVDSTASVGGTDSNSNQVRDDVERALATRLGRSPADYAKAIGVAAKLQTILSSPTPSASDAMFITFREAFCEDAAAAAIRVVAETESINNKERYAKAMDAYVAMVELKLASNDIDSLIAPTCP